MKFISICILMFYVILTQAQNDKKFIEQGNELYNKKQYSKALQDYQKATKQNPMRYEGQFNEGDALFRAGKLEEAAAKFAKAGSLTQNKQDLSNVYHNLGNTHLKAKKYQEGIEAYKRALKLNPKDEQTRYNLAYAQKMMQQQKNQDNKDKKDDKKDQKNQDQKQDKSGQDKKDEKNKDKSEQNKSKQDQKDQQDQQKSEANKSQMSKEDAERMLKAIENQERDLQESRKQQMLKGKKVIIEKDW